MFSRTWPGHSLKRDFNLFATHMYFIYLLHFCIHMIFAMTMVSVVLHCSSFHLMVPKKNFHSIYSVTSVNDLKPWEPRSAVQITEKPQVHD